MTAYYQKAFLGQSRIFKHPLSKGYKNWQGDRLAAAHDPKALGNNFKASYKVVFQFLIGAAPRTNFHKGWLGPC